MFLEVYAATKKTTANRTDTGGSGSGAAGRGLRLLALARATWASSQYHCLKFPTPPTPTNNCALASGEPLLFLRAPVPAVRAIALLCAPAPSRKPATTSGVPEPQTTTASILIR
jgi:hypothetical protein